MDDRNYLQPDGEQIESESAIHRALTALQEKARSGTIPERSAATISFLNSLHTLPDRFRSLVLRIKLDARDDRIARYKTALTALGITALDQEGMVYDLPVLTPRPVPTGGVIT